MAAFRIMIVEDQREVSRLLRSALETLEHDLAVVEIPSGEEAILYSTLNKVDLMVTDYRLPGMTGIELMVKVRKNQPEAKIILVTGMTDPRIRKQVAEAGANAFFIKPVPMADFLDAVERHLANRTQQSRRIGGPDIAVSGVPLREPVVRHLDSRVPVVRVGLQPRAVPDGRRHLARGFLRRRANRLDAQRIFFFSHAVTIL